jgi:hypothetical protein
MVKTTKESHKRRPLCDQLMPEKLWGRGWSKVVFEDGK